MGQKVNPHGLRVGVIKGWDAVWYANKKDFSDNLIEDHKVREFIKKKYYEASISRITIERTANRVIVDIHTARPGVLIGKSGTDVEAMRAEVQKLCAAGKIVNINIKEVRNSNADAQLVAEKIAAQLEKRASFRRTMKQAMSSAIEAGAKGIKTMVSGRLGGAEIARCEHYHEGSIPLQTLRANIEYGFAEANTTFGVIGVKVWIYKGEVYGGLAHKEGGNANVNA